MEPEAPSGIMSSIPEGNYTRAQVAAMVGRTRDTIIRWHNSGVFVPSHSKQYGKSKVWLYTDSDVEALRKIAKDMRTGPPRKEKVNE